MKKVNESKRSFGGKISDFKNRGEANFERAHLKNYLQGNRQFNYNGFQRAVKETWS
jgi:hypothetical protein